MLGQQDRLSYEILDGTWWYYSQKLRCRQIGSRFARSSQF